MIKPRRLYSGDTVAAISLSWGGPGAFPHRYQAGKRQLQDAFGVTIVETRHALADPDWLWRHPQARAQDLMDAVADPTIKGIFSTIGGEDSIRILPYLDLDLIRSNPKPFMGYSDTTITHMACLKAGLVSFYGPSIMAGFGENGGLLPYMVDAVRRTLFSSDPIGRFSPNSDGWTAEFLDWAQPENQAIRRKLHPSDGWRFLQGHGVWRGRLLGGCFDVLDWLRGTEFWPAPEQWQNAILFVETGENAPSPESVKERLRAWAALGCLERLSGILLGRPGGDIPPECFEAYDQAIQQIVTEEQGLTELPIVTRMDFGHTDPMFVLPFGIQAEIDCESQAFTIIENGVID